MVQIIFYHRAHTWAHGDPTHNAWVHITNVDTCSMCVSQVEGIYMDPSKVRVHREANL